MELLSATLPLEGEALQSALEGEALQSERETLAAAWESPRWKKGVCGKLQARLTPNCDQRTHLLATTPRLA